LRETEEEIGLQLQADTAIGRLSDVVTRQHARMLPMTVTPHAFALPDACEPQWQLNHEVAEVLWVPLSFFADARNRKIMHWRTGRVVWEMPCFFYEDRRIWGLTLLMLRELMGLTHGVSWRSIKPVRGSQVTEA
ncbi:MAG: NUDIX hydrolase, partial [Nevskiales bacterium]